MTLHHLPPENVVTAVASGAQLDFVLTPDEKLAVALVFTDHLQSNYRVLIDLAQCEVLYAGLAALNNATDDQLIAVVADLRAAEEGGDQ
jgi:hypothetical protein